MSELNHPYVMSELNHPYKQFEGTQLWEAVEAELDALEKNQDIELTTASEYIVGSICKRLAESELVTPEAITSK